MIEANATFDALLRLPQCVEIEPDKGFRRALLNVANGLTIMVPGGTGFSLFGNAGSKNKLGSDCLVIPSPPARLSADGQECFKVLAGDDLPAVRRTWEAQAKLLFGG